MMEKESRKGMERDLVVRRSKKRKRVRVKWSRKEKASQRETRRPKGMEILLGIKNRRETPKGMEKRRAQVMERKLKRRRVKVMLSQMERVRWMPRMKEM